jgi:hypothetical protein
MHYLKLELQRTDGTSIFHGDFELKQLDSFVRSFQLLLAKQDVLAPGEKCRIRIIPRSDNNPRFGQPVVLAVPPVVGDGQMEAESSVVPDIPSDGKITYFTIEIHATQAETMYRFDVQLEMVFGGVITKAVQNLLDEGSLADGERFRFLVSASGKTDGAHRKLPRVKMKKKEKIEAKPEIVVPAPPASQADDLNIIINSVEQLVTPQPRPMKSYGDVEAVGTIAGDEIPIFVQRTAMKVAERSAGSSSRSNEEVGGFLLGSVFRDPEDDRLFVEINEAVETDRARGTYVSLEFNYEAWRQVLDRIEGHTGDKVLVGWYHTHLVSLATAVPVEESPQEYVARYTTFFSQHDIFIHRHFFPSAWHVGLVMDLRCKKEVFFAWKSGQIAGNKGFYLYGQ